MMKKIIVTAVFLTVISLGHLGMARLHDEEGGMYDFDPTTSASNFFLEDVNDSNFKISLDAKQPDMMPCNGVITSNFGWRALSRHHARMHLGVDIAAPSGSPVVAPADGRVAFAGHKGGYGLAVIIDHGGELTTLYGHNSKLFVKEGDVVKRGQEISLVGSTGHSTGPHVHYEVRIDGNPINPSKFL
jgi:murein DD-endopeptidase MepM/ murein hydrolase activator NlpD